MIAPVVVPTVVFPLNRPVPPVSRPVDVTVPPLTAPVDVSPPDAVIRPDAFIVPPTPVVVIELGAVSPPFTVRSPPDTVVAPVDVSPLDTVSPPFAVIRPVAHIVPWPAP